MPDPVFDIVICGAGPVGLALATLLVSRGVAPDRLLLLDARPLEQARADPRSIALSHGSSQILQQAGAWPFAASPIREIHVSRRGHFGRTLIDCRDYGLPALGHVTRYGVLVDALAGACQRAGIQARRGDTVATITEDAGQAQAQIRLASGEELAAKIVVQAEGGLFADQAIKARRHDYQQTAIVAHVGVSAPLMQRAFERFTDEGPLALLPQADGANAAPNTASGFAANPGALSGARSGVQAGAYAGATQYALVWCMRPDSARRLMALPDAQFLSALQHAFGTRLGRFLHVSPRGTYGLGLNADPVATHRTVAIGNAAQTLHPVAGQGLNLGLRDASVLARLLAQEAGPAMLPRFLSQRQADRRTTIGLTDVMARIFASAPDGALSQALLGLSLGLVDGFAPARRVLAEQMMFGQRT